jgi:hypothetical protein
MKTERIENTRRVWRAITKAPTASYREIQGETGIGSLCTIHAALYTLASLGYVEIGAGERARRVLVAFGEAL